MARRTRLMTAVVLAPLALGLVACSDDDDDDDVRTSQSAESPVPTVTETVTPSAEATSTPSSTASAGTLEGDVATAVATALTEVEGTVVSVDSDSLGWSVSVLNASGEEFDVQLAPDAASVVGGATQEVEDADDVAENRRLLEATVDYAAAIEAARGESQGTVTGVELSEDDGRIVWDVQFDEDTATETTVDIDAQSGEVVRVEQGD